MRRMRVRASHDALGEGGGALLVGALHGGREVGALEPPHQRPELRTDGRRWASVFGGQQLLTTSRSI